MSALERDFPRCQPRKMCWSRVTLLLSSSMYCHWEKKKHLIYTIINLKKGIIKTKQKRPGNTHRHPIFAIDANCSRKPNATLIEIRNNRNNIAYSQQIETKSMLKKYIQTTSKSLEWKNSSTSLFLTSRW